MQNLILDTNVIVSALLSRNSPPALIIDELVLNRKVNLCLSEAIMAEYIDVLGRQKFARYPEFRTRAELLLHHLYHISSNFSPESALEIISDDDDNRFLELALSAQADFLITGNTNDFTLQAIGQTQIVTPRVYWDLYRPKE